MKWIETDERYPKSKGLYGVTNKSGALDFFIAFFDGIAFKVPNESMDNIAPYRTPKFWAKLVFGEDQ